MKLNSKLQILAIFVFVVIFNHKRISGFEIDHLVFDYPEVIPSYDNVVHKIQRLKSGLIKNYTSDEETGEFPPPMGTVVQRNARHGYIEMVTEVHVWIHPSRVVKVDIEQQSLTLITYQVYFWRDEALKWDKNQDGIPIEEVQLNAYSVWTPNIFPINSLDKVEVMDGDSIEVDSDGLCTLIKTVQYTIPCSVKIENFPFDEQNCSLAFSQLGNLHARIKMNPFSLTTAAQARVGDEDLLNERRFAHLEWEIQSSESRSIMDGYEVKFSVLLKRQSKFYATVLIFPVVLLNLLSLVVFTLPIDTTERENFALTLILTYFVSVMIIVEESPPTGNQMPYLGLYVILCTALVVITFGMSLLLIEIHEHCRAKHKRMARFLTLFLERVCSLENAYKASNHRNTSKHLLGSNIKEEDTTLYEDEELNPDMSEEEKIKESFKWKLLCKVLNLAFFFITLTTHVILACIIYFQL